MKRQMRTKTLVGRIFTLTNHKRMSFDCDTWALTRSAYAVLGQYVNKEKIGEAVVIYDESAKKAKIGTKTGHMIWISKAFLKQEAEQIIKSPKGEMQTIIDELTVISSKTSDDYARKNIDKLLVKARTVLSYIERI